MNTDNDMLWPIDRAYCVHCGRVMDCRVEYSGTWTVWHCLKCDGVCTFEDREQEEDV